jgi:hypothetical protein
MEQESEDSPWIKDEKTPPGGWIFPTFFGGGVLTIRDILPTI